MRAIGNSSYLLINKLPKENYWAFTPRTLNSFLLLFSSSQVRWQTLINKTKVSNAISQSFFFRLRNRGLLSSGSIVFLCFVTSRLRQLSVQFCPSNRTITVWSCNIYYCLELYGSMSRNEKCNVLPIESLLWIAIFYNIIIQKWKFIIESNCSFWKYFKHDDSVRI